MPRLTHRDKLEVLTRNRTFMSHLEELNIPFTLDSVFSQEPRERNKVLRGMISTVYKDWAPSPQAIKAKLDRLRSNHGIEESPNGVRAIPENISIGDRTTPGTIRYLRDGRFLTLEIDLMAGTKDAIIKEIAKKIDTFKLKIGKAARRRKAHKSTS